MQYPYPKFIAHRGGGDQAPENTLAAFKLGFSQGYTMFECDVKLSEDGQLFLLHDDTLDRTTSGKDSAKIKWEELSQLDAGSWFGPKFNHEPIPLLEQIVNFTQEHNAFLNVEIKPNPNQDYKTGMQCAKFLQQFVKSDQNCPFLLSSFSEDALRGAYDAGTTIPRALLLEHWRDSAWETVSELECSGFVVNYKMATQEFVAKCRALKRFVIVYTANDEQEITTLLDNGVDSIITDNMSLSRRF